MAEGTVRSCGAFTEPDHDSDMISVNTTAVRDGEVGVINGSKIFITNAGSLAGFYSVLCQTDPEASPNYRGMSLILVEADRPGVSTVEVMKVLYRHPDVLEVVVVPVADAKWGEVSKAFIVSKPGSNPHVFDIIDFCKANLARFKAPKYVEFGELPKRLPARFKSSNCANENGRDGAAG